MGFAIISESDDKLLEEIFSLFTSRCTKRSSVLPRLPFLKLLLACINATQFFHHQDQYSVNSDLISFALEMAWISQVPIK
uniref:Uncharacterized protein n=1 Tax=Physcomitrium patens TaxID=3218 RepID=A0A2K1J0V9_PHYPA|nr:hypothetical protein PHYPA_023056 [Physcomitrium patens]